MVESNKTSESRKEKKRAYDKLYSARRKEEREVINKLYREGHKEEKHAYDKLYRAKHKEKRLALNKLYRDSHREEMRASRKRHRDINKKDKPVRKKLDPAIHKEILRAYGKLYRDSHREEVRASQKRYRDSHKEERNAYARAYTKKRYRNDPVYKLTNSVRTTILKGFCKLGYSKNKRTHEILGCPFNHFVTYIENQLKEGMTLENHGAWQLDHMVPISLAKTVEDVIALNHYSNFQPLWKEDNIKKSDKLILDIISPENKIRYKTIIDRHGNKSI